MNPTQSQTYTQHATVPLQSQISSLERLINEDRRTDSRWHELIQQSMLPQTSILERLINDEGRRTDSRWDELIQQYMEGQREPIQFNLDPDVLRRMVELPNLDRQFTRRPVEEILIQKKSCCCSEAFKIALIAIGILFIGAGFTCHFMRVHPAAFYSFTGIGSILTISASMMSLINDLKRYNSSPSLT